MNTHSVFHRTILSALVLSLLACSSDDRGPGGSPEFKVHEAQDVNAAIPNFKSDGLFSEVIKDDQERHKFEYANGCQTEEKDVIDKDVRVGDSQLSRVLVYKSDFHMEQISRETVQALISKTDSDILNEIISISVAEAGGSVLAQKISYVQKCRTNDGKSECSSDNLGSEGKSEEQYMESVLTAAGFRFFKDRETNGDIECYIENGQTKDDRIAEIGTYTFADGSSVKALKIVYTTIGDVVCSKKGVKQNMGPGKSVYVGINSNQVVPKGDDKYNCGGTDLTDATTVFLGDKVIQSTRQEVLSARLR